MKDGWVVGWRVKNEGSTDGWRLDSKTPRGVRVRYGFKIRIRVIKYKASSVQSTRSTWHRKQRSKLSMRILGTGY